MIANHKWEAVENLGDCSLKLRCLTCGCTGIVSDPTTEELQKALPYRWTDNIRAGGGMYFYHELIKSEQCE